MLMVHLAKTDPLDLLGLLELLVNVVQLDLLVKLVLVDQLGLLVKLVNKDPLGLLGLLDPKDLLVQLEKVVLVENLD